MLNLIGGKSSLPYTSSTESHPVISKVKCDKAAGKSGIILGMCRGAVEDIISPIIILTNYVIFDGQVKDE